MQIDNDNKITQANDLSDILKLSFMQTWYCDGLFAADMTGTIIKICDYAIWLKNELLLIQDVRINVKHSDKTKQTIKYARKNAVYKAHKSLLEAVTLIKEKPVFEDKEGLKPLNLPENVKIFSLCVTDIRVIHKKMIKVSHGYDSRYFNEECVLDFDAEHALQVFSIMDFSLIVQQLKTFPDFIDFLIFHKNQLVSGQPFAKESQLLSAYIVHGHVFATARKVDQQLLETGLRDATTPQLYYTPEEQQKNFKMISDVAGFWSQLLTVYAQQIPKEQLKTNNKYKNLLQALLDESLFSRFWLSQCVFNYFHASKADKQEGYLVHLRSYTNPARHYAFLFYAQNEQSAHHQKKAKAKLSNIAAGINFHEQNPVLDDVIVIGLVDNQGELGTDIYYTAGKPVDKSLHNPNAAVPHTPSVIDNTNQASNQANANKTVNKNKVNSQFSIKQKLKKKPNTQTNQPMHTNHVSSRNDPCPCGSGKKYRHCHGAIKNYQAY